MRCVVLWVAMLGVVVPVLFFDWRVLVCYGRMRVFVCRRRGRISGMLSRMVGWAFEDGPHC